MLTNAVETDLQKAQAIAKKLVENVEQVIVGKHQAIEMAVIALMSHGHLLIEDAPGVGKTILARSLAKSLDCNFKRIQFTPDMLPTDITGVSVYNQKTSTFEFVPGPIMAQIVLADEINRAAPKVQSALLECMEERQISIDGITYKMPVPFHILATQNPIEFEGTFPLPETQLDRFLLRINIGYPTVSEEIEIMERQHHLHPIEELKPIADAADMVLIQETIKKIYVDDTVKRYISLIVDATRHHSAIYLGSSPRGSLALFRTSQARALINGRDYVLPDDVKNLAESVLSHRIVLKKGGVDFSGKNASTQVVSEILRTIRIPGISRE